MPRSKKEYCESKKEHYEQLTRLHREREENQRVAHKKMMKQLVMSTTNVEDLKIMLYNTKEAFIGLKETLKKIPSVQTMHKTDICVLCKANPTRSCDCREPKVTYQVAPEPKLIDELNDIKLTGSWDVYYTGMEGSDRPRCLIRSDGMTVYATVMNQDRDYTRWSVGGKGARQPVVGGHFDTAKEAMAWVDANIVERDRNENNPS